MKRNVLIVEDEAILSMMYKKLLERNGFNVVGTAFSGDAAVSEALHLCPDIILMDIFLKGEMDGIDAAEKINKTLNVPIVYITGNSDSATRERAFKTGPAGYLEKPIDENILLSMMEKLDKD